MREVGMPRDLASEYADKLNGSMNSCFKISLIFGVGIFPWYPPF
jgi:hypothetical protein